MIKERKIDGEPRLVIPESLKPRPDQTLPKLTYDTLLELEQNQWSTIGIIVTFIDIDGNVMLLKHRGSSKSEPGAWGPLSETSKHSGQVIEQPIETLFRGIREELGITNLGEEPRGLWMHKHGGWVINQWPLGSKRNGEGVSKYVAGISFPIFVSDSTKVRLESFHHATEEVSDMCFMSPNNVAELLLRPGVEDLLDQLNEAGLLELNPYSDLQPVDFSAVYSASLQDIELGK